MGMERHPDIGPRGSAGTLAGNRVSTHTSLGTGRIVFKPNGEENEENLTFLQIRLSSFAGGEFSHNNAL
jgi:hypothetical protein